MSYEEAKAKAERLSSDSLRKPCIAELIQAADKEIENYDTDLHIEIKKNRKLQARIKAMEEKLQSYRVESLRKEIFDEDVRFDKENMDYE